MVTYQIRTSYPRVSITLSIARSIYLTTDSLSLRSRHFHVHTDHLISVDPEEVEILRAAQVIDQHLILKPSEPEVPDSEPQQLHLLGY